MKTGPRTTLSKAGALYVVVCTVACAVSMTAIDAQARTYKPNRFPANSEAAPDQSLKAKKRTSSNPSLAAIVEEIRSYEARTLELVDAVLEDSHSVSAEQAPEVLAKLESVMNEGKRLRSKLKTVPIMGDRRDKARNLLDFYVGHMTWMFTQMKAGIEENSHRTPASETKKSAMNAMRALEDALKILGPYGIN